MNPTFQGWRFGASTGLAPVLRIGRSNVRNALGGGAAVDTGTLVVCVISVAAGLTDAQNRRREKCLL